MEQQSEGVLALYYNNTMSTEKLRQSFDSISNGSDSTPEKYRPSRDKSSRAAWLANVDEEELVSIENLAAHQAEVDLPSPNSKRQRCCCCDLYTLWKFTGPGWLMSIAYLDPGNLEADLQSGAYTGYQLLWMLFWATIAGLLLQILAARLGVVTGKNLAQMCRLEYSRPVSNLLWVMTETAIIGSDIQEVLGSAIALKLLFGLDLWVGCLITGLDTFTFLIIHAYGVRKLEAFFAALIFTMMVCFFVNFGFTGPQWMGGPWNVDGGGILLGTLVPTVNDYAVIQAVGILGAVIMPHNIYLHSALVQSRNINRKNPQAVEEACKYNAIESAVALIVSFFINAAVVTVFARGFYADGQCAEPGWNQHTWSGGRCTFGVRRERQFRLLHRGRCQNWTIWCLPSIGPRQCHQRHIDVDDMHQFVGERRSVLFDRVAKRRASFGGSVGQHRENCVGNWIVGGGSRYALVVLQCCSVLFGVVRCC